MSIYLSHHGRAREHDYAAADIVEAQLDALADSTKALAQAAYAMLLSEDCETETQLPGWVPLPVGTGFESHFLPAPMAKAFGLVDSICCGSKLTDAQKPIEEVTLSWTELGDAVGK